MGLFQGSKLDFLVAKSETTAGTAITLAQADFDVDVIAESIEYTPEVPMDDENSARASGHHAENDSVPGMQTATVAFNVRYRWSGAVATAPALSKFLKACGLKGTAVSTTGYKWEPDESADVDTVTIGIFYRELGSTTQYRRITLAGCMGNCVMAGDNVEAPLILQFTFSGKIVSEADDATGIVENPNNLDSATPEKMGNTPVSYGGVSICVSTFSFDFGNVIEPVLCQSEATGVEYFHIGERHPRITTNPYILRISELDDYGKLKNGTPAAFTMAFSPNLPASGDNHLKINCPVTQMITMARSVREAKRANDLTLKVRKNDPFISTYNASVGSTTSFQLLQGK